MAHGKGKGGKGGKGGAGKSKKAPLSRSVRSGLQVITLFGTLLTSSLVPSWKNS